MASQFYKKYKEMSAVFEADEISKRSAIKLKQEQVFDELKARIVVEDDSTFQKTYNKILEAVEAPVAPTTTPTRTTEPSPKPRRGNPIQTPSPGRKSKPKARKFFDKIKSKYNL